MGVGDNRVIDVAIPVVVYDVELWERGAAVASGIDTGVEHEARTGDVEVVTAGSDVVGVAEWDKVHEGGDDLRKERRTVRLV